MTSTAPHSEETVFATALAMPESARAVYLDQACGGDAALRASVEALLRAHLAVDGAFLPSVPGVGRAAVAPAPRAEEQPGDWIGRYKLLQKIGEGGCGIVYLAEQEQPIRRRVALKVIKLGMDTKAVVARFEAERQALAMMDHPNIARVLDAGTTDSGRPFFVMELVRGIPVTKYCDEQNLPTEQRLELFGRICHALQHAHQKGIIHRDIKPSNILVTLHDGVPVPKVIDFGIAKATQGKLTGHTYFTAFEQFIGTPAYMSPEQAEMSGLDIDTRSDIYSLGVLLYELLAGRPPFDPKTFLAAGLDEMRRLIREVDPPRPSARLSTLTDADRTTVARQRRTAPSQLSTELAGDLDWIVMRCIEKDRTRRYATPSELSADIERHLNHEPVTARPPSAAYLARKLFRRHKLGFIAGGAIAASLITGMVMSSLALVRARNAAARSEQVARFMEEMLKGLGPSAARGRDSKVVLREALDSTAKRLDTDLAGQPAVAADLQHTLGKLYFDIGEYGTAEPLLRAAIATRRTLGGSHAETAASLHLLGQVLIRRNQFSEAESALQEALTIRRALPGRDHRLVEDTLSQLAELSAARQGPTEPRSTLEEVLITRRKALGNEHPDVATTLYDLGRAAQAKVDHVKAAKWLEESLAIRLRVLPKDDPVIAATREKLGWSYAHELDRQRDAAVIFDQAFTSQRKVLGDQNPRTIISLLRLTGQFPARDIPPDTLVITRELVASQRKDLLPGSALLAPTLLALASLEAQPDRDPELATSLVREAGLLLDRSLANGSTLEPDLIEAMAFFAWSKFIGNMPAEGLPMAEQAFKLARAASKDGARLMLPTQTLAWINVALGRPAQTAPLLEAAVSIYGKYGDDFPITLVDVAALGACERALDRVAESHHRLETALAALDAKPATASATSHVGMVRAEFGLTLLREGRFAEAEAVLRQAVSEYKRTGLKALPLRLHPKARAMSGLGQALAAQGEFTDAESLVTEAFEELRANEHHNAGDSAGMVREAGAAVLALYTAWGKPDKVAEWKARLDEFARREDSAGARPLGEKSP